MIFRAFRPPSAFLAWHTRDQRGQSSKRHLRVGARAAPQVYSRCAFVLEFPAWAQRRRGRSDMSMDSGDANQLQRALAQSIHEHWVLFLIEGIILVVLGVLAIIIPPLATIAVTIFLGWLLLISGIVGLVTTFWARHAPGFWWSLLSAVLAIAAGIVLLGWPVRGAISLTLLLIVFFIIEGVLSIMYAFEHKKELSGQWGWMLVS